MPIPLDIIIARTTQPQPQRERRPAATPPIKLADIERRSRLTPHTIPSDPETPRALVLITVTTTCLNCSHTWEHPNQNLLVRYDNHGLSNSVKYTKRDIEPFLGLPRERKHVTQSTPFCERCFSPEKA